MQPKPDPDPPAWKHDGVRVVPGDQLDPNTAQTPGMDRKAAINFARVGAQKAVGRHRAHPCQCEDRRASSRAARERHLRRQGPRAHALGRTGSSSRPRPGPGDFIYVPPFVPHQEINASPTEALECVLVRSDGEAIAVNLDIEPVEKPETVRWVDPIHRR